MKPSEVSDELVGRAADEAADIVKRLRKELAKMEIADPDSLVVAMSSMLVDAHVAAGGRSPAAIVGSFALVVTQMQLSGMPIDDVPKACAELMRHLATRMESA